MSYIESNNLTVFPISIPRAEDPVAHVLTERNLVSLTKNILDYPSYVITETESFDTNTPFEFKFVLDGYYFKIDNFLPDKDAYKIYAKIVFAKENSENNSAVTFQHIAGDDSNNFTGLELELSYAQNEDKTGFPLLMKNDNGKWVVPNASRRKFNLASVNGDIIDGGQDQYQL